LLDLKPRAITVAVEQGLVVPHEGKQGRGHSRYFNRLNLIELLAVDRLRQFGLMPRAIRRIVPLVANRTFLVDPFRYLIRWNGQPHWIAGDTLDHLSSFTAVLWLDCQALEEQVDKVLDRGMLN